MRVIGGEFGGRRIPLPKGVKLRPTTDMAREALFNILTNRIDLESTYVADLFSGTGAVALEFISRGAPGVVAIEQNPVAAKGIYQLSDHFGLTKLQLIRRDVFRWLDKAPQGMFDLVFADPPFAHPRIAELPGLILSSGCMKQGGMLVLEHPPGLDYKDMGGFGEMRRYGHVHFSFFSA